LIHKCYNQLVISGNEKQQQQQQQKEEEKDEKHLKISNEKIFS